LSGGGALAAQLVSSPTFGSLTFNSNGGFVYVPTCVGAHTFTYRATNTLGTTNVATVSISVQAAGSVQPPCGLYVSSVQGNAVTLRWSEPALGPTPTGFVLQGGLTPGQVLASVPTNSPYPIYAFTAPTGSFFVRAHSADGAIVSVASNEVPLHVNVPVPPSAPVHLLGSVAGSSLTLAWTNTFSGGAPTGLFLDVNGAVNGTLPIGPADTFSLDGVPAGVYTLSLRAANAAGTSASSNPVTLTFPGGCSGAPLPPADFLAFDGGGNMLSLAWDAAAAGAAPSGFVLAVTGSFMGSVPVSGRRLNAAVPSGAYGLRLQAVNACGASAFSPVQTVVIP